MVRFDKRLDDLLSPPVAALRTAALEALMHGLDQGARRFWSPLAGCFWRPVAT
jgi:hypothetical protein